MKDEFQDLPAKLLITFMSIFIPPPNNKETIMNYVNLTPHAINLNDGRNFPATGTVARVSQEFTEIVDDVCTQQFGDVENLPEPVDGVRYIVSGFVLAACKDRQDVVAPATGHKDTVRNEKGHIVSVPCFVKN